MSLKLPAASVSRSSLSRRGFLKLATYAGLGYPVVGRLQPASELGRITEPQVTLRVRPDPDGSASGRLEFDNLVEINRRVIGRGVYPHNHLWLETPEGYLWSSQAQIVRNAPNPVLSEVPESGLWTEITVPYVDGQRRPDPAAATVYRLYYGMVLNVDRRELGADGQVWYRVHDENGVVMYAPGQAFRWIAPQELTPISPEVEDKAVVVDISRQVISAMESGVERYFARISSGYTFYPQDGGVSSNTPIGQMWTWRKMVSRHMSGGDAVSGYDLPGVGWTVLFHGSGAALHSTYWHADYGAPRSRGCINLRPEDAKWFFRWTHPVVDYRPGDRTVQWPNPGTRVIVKL